MGYQIPVRLPVVLTYSDPGYRPQAMVLAQLVERELMKPQYFERLNAIIEEASNNVTHLIPKH